MPLSSIPITNICKRGCCWTPYGTCARQHGCPHHVRERAEKSAREARAALAREAENLENLRVGRQSGSRAWKP